MIKTTPKGTFVPVDSIVPPLRKMKHMRENYIDIAKECALIAMILGHSFGKYNDIFESFHMPLFFILSGYFFTRRENFEVLKKGMKGLLKPYFVTLLILIIIGFNGID